MHLANTCYYREGERDLVLLRHEIIHEDEDGKRFQHDIDFVHYGDEYGWSAMAKTVSLPLAIAARLSLTGAFEGQVGMIRPLEKWLYEPVLRELRRLDLHSRYSVKEWKADTVRL